MKNSEGCFSIESTFCRLFQRQKDMTVGCQFTKESQWSQSERNSTEVLTSCQQAKMRIKHSTPLLSNHPNTPKYNYFWACLRENGIDWNGIFSRNTCVPTFKENRPSNRRNLPSLVENWAVYEHNFCRGWIKKEHKQMWCNKFCAVPSLITQWMHSVIWHEHITHVWRIPLWAAPRCHKLQGKGRCYKSKEKLTSL